ncbi:hypothetical protein BLI708_08505 [Bifidobacterium imperatoris]|uniref:Cryptic prophage protein n=1 Tax=Bifidobacterium imperatoris TaxID=2020965 RepID=A0A2N5IQJ8_9BIFI|nr:hypothetical protein [Bifidobacterium imperatoris]PLS24234.1 cryptic prophage protein [Bifidobacterium imperatoris]QSY57273.1 hypothetical protein BLI708_08505 [Bifidobacterium imperatoris]
MSQQATAWTLYEAPIELDAIEFRLLTIIADNVDNEGRGFGKSVKTLMELYRAPIGERTVRAKLAHMVEIGVLREGDQRLVSYLPGNRRPKVYDIVMNDRGAEYAPLNDDDAYPINEPASEPETETESEPVIAADEWTTDEADPDASQGCSRGAAGVQLTCSRGARIAADKSIKSIKNIKNIKREYARAKTQTETTTSQPTDPRQALADFQPDQTHIALADAFGLDLDYELAKFRDALDANGKYPSNPAPAFRNWLRRGKEIGLSGAKLGTGMPDAPDPADMELERRARKLVDSSTRLKQRQPDPAIRHEWIPAVARLLGQGKAPTDIVDRICLDQPDELTELGIHVDGLEAIA